MQIGLLIVIIVKRQILRMLLLSERGPHSPVGSDAPKVLKLHASRFISPILTLSLSRGVWTKHGVGLGLGHGGGHGLPSGLPYGLLVVRFLKISFSRTQISSWHETGFSVSEGTKFCKSYSTRLCNILKISCCL